MAKAILTRYEAAIILTDVVETIVGAQVANIKRAGFHACIWHVRNIKRNGQVSVMDHIMFDSALRCLEHWQIQYLTNLGNHAEL